MKDVENRLWQAAKAPGRILIHATKTKVPRNWELCPDDYVATIKDARLMGNIPEYEDMPYGSIIGYVDCYQIVKDSPSFWAQPDSFHWCLKDAYLFDEPIPDIKGVRGHLFDVDIDEDNLPPAHKVELKEVSLEDGVITMPASEAVMARVEAGEKEIMYDFSPSLSAMFYNQETGVTTQAESVRFVCGDRVLEKEIDEVIVDCYTDMNGEVVPYYGYDGTPLYYAFFALLLK